MEFYRFDTSFGPMALGEEDGAIVRLYLPNSPTPRLTSRPTPLLEEGERQLREYLSGTRQTFALPLDLKGTPFQQRVWRALLDIPYSQTRTYGDIARAADSHRGFRAVGMANNRNPVPILVPCHRVVGAGGALVGYAGGLELKAALLALERRKR